MALCIAAREAGGSAVARFTGSIAFLIFHLGLAPQALCFRPLRGLKKFQADGGGDFFDEIGWSETAGAGVDGKSDDVV